MDGRYGVQRGWEHNSALEAYDAVHEPNYRVGAAYDDRRYIDDRFPGDNSYSRGAFNRDVERDSYAASPPAGLWSQTRRRDYEEEYPLDRESRKHDRSYVEPYDEIDDVHGNHRFGRYGMRDRDDYVYDNYEYKHRRDSSHDRDYDYGRRSHDSDYDRSRRDGSWRRHDSRDRDRDRGRDRDRDRREVNHERDLCPYRRRDHSRSRSRSRGRDDRSKSRSPRSPRSRSRGCSRSHREDSYEDRYDKPERRRDREEKRRDHYSVAPSATVVIKGLSPNTTEEDLHQFLAEWGPIRNVRVIKERDSGLSRGFAFLDFHSVDAAQAMMNKVGVEGLVVDGRKLLFEYSSKPTGVSGGSSYGQDGPRSSHGSHRNTTMPSDWMCIICGCVNFARRVSCFQCNESRTNDAPAADVSSSHASSGRKGFEAGPTHVLVVRGLDENADEEMLRYEFSKHAPIKDLRLVRDKFTHVSRGFAFVHFYSVEDATKALDATNGTTLERNGQILRVAYAKSVFGPGGPSGYSQSSSLAAAAIEAAAFSQQYDAVGWAPKEYNVDDKPVGGQEQGSEVAGQKEGSAPQSGFVWDETSGYYYDAASGFYYDPNTGLYYDGNNGVWYTFDNKTQQYVPCTDQNANTKSEKESEAPKTENNTARKVVISAPAATISSSEKPASLPDAVQAAASAALAAEKREKEKAKEIKLAAKSSILANKKKMSNVLSMWKQRSHEGQTPRVALDDGQTPVTADDRPSSATSSLKPKVAVVKDTANIGSGFLATTPSTQALVSESESKSWPANNSSKGTLMGVIRGSGRGVVKSDTVYSGTTAGPSTPSSLTTSAVSSAAYSDAQGGGTTSFKTDVSALGGYTPPTASGGRRRFSETPMQPVSGQREQNQTSYRDRAAERRRMYGSSSSYVDDGLEAEDPNDGVRLRKVSSELGAMPFPPGVGGRGPADSVAQTYDVITPDKAIDESNVGNRMLRSMGWTDGSGLGRDGSGMVEPVQAQAFDNRAGLGTQPKKADPTLEVHPGDSYKTLIQKKALQRFREMS